jgi:hypothetical protein
MKKQAKTLHPMPLLAAILAWLVPGAGHIYLGRPVRGIVIFITIAATFWGGVAMGGVMTVDPETERWWFASEMLTGVHGLVAWQRTRAVYREIGSLDPLSTDAALAAKGIVLVEPTSTVARAYSGIAGLLNILCVFDATLLALMGVTGEEREEREPSSAGKSP